MYTILMLPVGIGKANSKGRKEDSTIVTWCSQIVRYLPTESKGMVKSVYIK